jgi:4-amino-4-deoxy-L-arabinose transferase-like glycosyltransferase
MTPFLNRDPWLESILLCALVARLIFFMVYPDVFFPDTIGFQRIGQQIFSGQIISNDIYMPLYPIWVQLMGGGFTLKLADILLSTGMVFLIYKLSFALFSNRLTSLVAAVITAFYPHFLFYAVTGLTETAFTFLLVAAFWVLYRGNIYLGSVLLVSALLVRPSLDFLNPLLIIIFTFFVHRSGWKTSLKHLAAYIMIYGILMTPWWMHQYKKYDTFIRLNLGDGVVLYAGNNPLNRTGGGIGGKDKDVDHGQFSYIKDPVELNNFKRQLAIDYILDNPTHFVKMAGVKFMRFWRLYPFASQYQQWHVILTSLLSYGVVLFLATGLLICNGKKYFLRLLPILGLIVYLTLVHVITIGSIRYRFPLEPFLIIFAAHFVATVGENTNLVRKLKEKIALI